MRRGKLSGYKLLIGAIAGAVFCLANAAANLAPTDETEIRELMTKYAQALSGCHAEEFADLFVPETGYFASGFRGHIVGRERLVELVESERHCRAAPGAPQAARAGGAKGPAVEISATADGARGVANLGMAEYQDQYAKTPQGWRFASRTVIIAAEKAAGLDAAEMLAINELGGDKLGDYYEADDNGVPRLLTSGVRIEISEGQVKGRAFLKDGSYDDEVYEKVSPSQWRVKSSAHVPAHSH